MQKNSQINKIIKLKMSLFLANMFKKIDLFGQPVLLKFRGNEKSKSPIGGWFSLCLLGFILFATYIVGKDIVYRRNPKLIMSEAYSENPEPLALSTETFTFAAGLQVPITYAHYINESIYTLEAQFTRQIRTIDQNGELKIKAEYFSLALERCTKQHFGTHSSKFGNLELNELYCLKKEQPGFDRLILQGTFESPIFQDIEIIVKPCDSEISKVQCAPKEILDEMLMSCYFAIYYTNHAVDAKNATYPSFIFRDSYYTTVSNSFFKDIPLWLRHVQVKTDFGWLLTNEEINNFVKVGHIGESAAFLQKDQKRMINLRIRMDKITVNFERSYLKIGDIVASVNGFAAIGFLIVLLFIGPYSKIKFYENLINELFDLKILQRDMIRNRSPKMSNNSNKSQSIDIKEEIYVEKDEVKMNVNSPNHQNLLTDGEKDNRKSSISSNQVCHPQNTDFPDILNKSNHQPPAPKYLFDSSVSNVSIKIKSSGPEFLWKKPELSNNIQAKTNTFISYEPTCPAETFAVLESLIMESKELNRTKSIKLARNPSIFRREKARKSNKSFEVESKRNENEGKLQNIYEHSYERSDDVEIQKKTTFLSSHLNKVSDKLSISFKEYVCSYFWKTRSLKAKLKLLEEGIRRIEERIDIFNVMKKFREVDKLKLLLLENEQLVLFDTLPKPELLSGNYLSRVKRKSMWFGKFKDTRFISEQRKQDLILVSYKNLKRRRNKTMIDEKLLNVYDDLINNS